MRASVVTLIRNTFARLTKNPQSAPAQADMRALGEVVLALNLSYREVSSSLGDDEVEMLCRYMPTDKSTPWVAEAF